MNLKSYIEGNWHKVKGAVKEAFGKLTDQQLMESEGNYEKLLGYIQSQYALTRDEAEKKIREFREHNGNPEEGIHDV